MAMTLDDIFIPTCQQILTSSKALLDKAQAQITNQSLQETEVVNARLIDDMWPLANQIQSLWVHSAYAAEQVKTGEFRPNIRDIPDSLSAMQATLDRTLNSLAAIEAGELEAIANEPLNFIIGGKVRFSFTVQHFLLSFSMPNMHFHATTAYGILRQKGVALGKFDYLGNMRTQPISPAFP